MTRRTAFGIGLVVALSGVLAWRIHVIRRPAPPVVLQGRAAELDYVRYLGHRLQRYATAYGHPIYHYEIRDGRYAVEFAKARAVPAESLEIATLRRLLFSQPNIGYGFDERYAYISWYHQFDPLITKDSFPWPAGVDVYVASRKASVAPRHR